MKINLTLLLAIVCALASFLVRCQKQYTVESSYYFLSLAVVLCLISFASCHWKSMD